MNTHVMLDLETMGTGTDAAIIAIGAVKFDPRNSGILDAFYCRVDLTSSLTAGLTVTGSTIDWWMKDDLAEARARLKSTEPLPLWEALGGFNDWYEKDKGDISIPVWGNGAMFDNAIMRSAYGKLSMRCPWSFREDRCFRTLKSLAPQMAYPVDPGEFVAHFALDDARYQAHLMQVICHELEIDP